MDVATSYAEWQSAAQQLDVLEGKHQWKISPESPYYDSKRILHNLTWLRGLVDKQDVKGIMHYLRSRLLRNLGGIGNPELYTYLRAGGKALIEDYTSEVVRALQFLCVVDTPDITKQQKLAFFNETRHAFGRTALLLSGGATLGMYHLGVIRAMAMNNMLPRIISGSSVGSLIAAIAGTRTDEELCKLDRPGTIEMGFFPTQRGTLTRRVKRFFESGVVMDIQILQRAIRANVPDLTFQEAYERTGRIINIALSPSDSSKDVPHLLNYLSAPNVLVWSAALASCAIPYVYAPVELMAKDASGHLVPYFSEGGVKFADGSINSDLPMRRLAELFNVNHFIVSQVNPHVIPFVVSDSNEAFSPISPTLKIIKFLNRQVKSILIGLAELGVPFPSLVRDLMVQRYMGDITLVPAPSWSDFGKLLENPTNEILLHHIRVSERLTWQKLAHMRAQCEIEFTLDDCVRRMRGSMLLQEFRSQMTFNNLGAGRVSSWTPEQFAKARQAVSAQWEGETGVDSTYSELSDRDLFDRTDAYSDTSVNNTPARTPHQSVSMPSGWAGVPAAAASTKTFKSMPSPTMAFPEGPIGTSSPRLPNKALTPTHGSSNSIDAVLMRLNQIPASALPAFVEPPQHVSPEAINHNTNGVASAAQSDSGTSTPTMSIQITADPSQPAGSPIELTEEQLAVHFPPFRSTIPRVISDEQLSNSLSTTNSQTLLAAGGTFAMRRASPLPGRSMSLSQSASMESLSSASGIRTSRSMGKLNF
jgi:predicted acylesterase/phospholipase RssA